MARDARGFGPLWKDTGVWNGSVVYFFGTSDHTSYGAHVGSNDAQTTAYHASGPPNSNHDLANGKWKGGVHFLCQNDD